MRKTFIVNVKIIEYWRVAIEADTAEEAENIVLKNCDMDALDGTYDYTEREVCGSDPV